MGLRVQPLLRESSLPFSFINAFMVCSGNNAITFNGNISGTAPQTSANLNFIYIQNPSQAPTVPANKNAAIINVFYVTNSIHDISYKLVFLFLFYFIPSVDSASDRYGFTETAYNFQNNNFGTGGLGNRRIVASIQDSGGANNANFATPPGGQFGYMKMYLWDFTNISILSISVPLSHLVGLVT